MALGHLDELQKADKYPIGRSLSTGFTVFPFLIIYHTLLDIDSNIYILSLGI